MEGTCNRCVFPAEEHQYVGTTSLMHAVWKGYVQCVKELIAAGADVNQKDDDDYGATPLTNASYKGYLEIVQELIKAGADVNQTDDGNYGATPLILAACHVT